MDGPHHIFHEGNDTPDEIIAIKREVEERLMAAADFEPAAFVTLEILSDQTWREAIGALDDPDSLGRVDWAKEKQERSEESALGRLAAIKAVLPEDNVETRKDQHNVSLENYIRLALETANDTPTLRIFMEIVRAKLIHDAENPQLAQQALSIWAPAAQIAGWHKLRTELEEVAFEQLYPSEKQSIIDTYAHLGGDEALSVAVEEYRDGTRAILQDELSADASFTVSGRRKSYYSVWRKVTKDNRPSYALSDFLGIRVVVDSAEGEEKAVEHCYAVADMITQSFDPELDRYKDYISNPKSNGYQSLHMTVTDINGARVEFQVRTAVMHQKAETDPNASHMIYDATNKLTPGRYFRKLAKPHRIYAWRDKVAAEIRQRREAGNDSLQGLEPDKILAFADDGNLYQLNAGDTALDFAFALHTARALTVQSISRDGAPLRFDSPLRFGETIVPTYHPDKALTWAESWFGKVHSSVAIQRLLKARRERGQETYIARAVERIDEHFGERNVLKRLSDEQRAALAKRYGIPQFEVVLRNIGANVLGIGKVLYHVARYLDTAEKESSQVPEQTLRRSEKTADQSYTDRNGRQWEIAVLETLRCRHHIAGCCPIETGEPIVAVPSRLRGDFSVHKPKCVNLPKDDRKVLHCTWHQIA